MYYAEKIKQHKINDEIIKLDQVIEGVTQIKYENPEDIDALARIKQVYEGFKIAYRNCDINLISINWLESACNAIIRIENNLNSYQNSRNANYLQEAMYSELDVLLEHTAKINCVRNRQSLKGVAEAFSSYVEIMNTNIEKISTKSEEIDRHLDEVEKEINKNKVDFEQELEKTTQRIDREQQRMDQFSDAHQNQRNDAAEKFSELMDSFREKFNATQDENRAAFGDSQKEYEKSRDNLLQQYEDKYSQYEDQVKNIVGTINTNIFSHRYKEVADNARGRAKWWHGCTIVLLLGVVGFAIYAFVFTSNVDTSWVKLVAKIFATTTIASGAAYAARQASKQEKVERYARMIEMQLVSIDPFIESLDEERRAKIKEELAFKIFGKDDVMELSTKDSEDEMAIQENLMNKVITLVKMVK